MTTFIGSLFVVVGIGVLGWGILCLIRSIRSRSWPTAQGTVLESEVKMGVTFDNDQPDTQVHVKYRYSVGRRTYQSDTVQFGRKHFTQNPADCERVVSEFPVGTEVSVYYDPDNPSTAVLKQGNVTFALPTLFLGVLSLGIGCWVMTFR